jgi:hypothetical protein
MNKFVSLLTLGGLFLLIACQAPNSSASESDPTSQSPPTSEPVNSPNEQVSTPIGDTPSPIAQEMVRLSVENLSKRLKIGVDQIRVVKVEAVNWRDASLGCPKPIIDFVRVETPGYRILLEAGGNEYDYHTNETNRVILCVTR